MGFAAGLVEAEDGRSRLLALGNQLGERVEHGDGQRQIGRGGTEPEAGLRPHGDEPLRVGCVELPRVAGLGAPCGERWPGVKRELVRLEPREWLAHRGDHRQPLGVELRRRHQQWQRAEAQPGQHGDLRGRGDERCESGHHVRARLRGCGRRCGRRLDALGQQLVGPQCGRDDGIGRRGGAGVRIGRDPPAPPGDCQPDQLGRIGRADVAVGRRQGKLGGEQVAQRRGRLVHARVPGEQLGVDRGRGGRARLVGLARRHGAAVGGPAPE